MRPEHRHPAHPVLACSHGAGLLRECASAALPRPFGPREGCRERPSRRNAVWRAPRVRAGHPGGCAPPAPRDTRRTFSYTRLSVLRSSYCRSRSWITALGERVSVFPPAPEPSRCQFAIPDGVLDGLVPEVSLQSARVVTLVRELVAASVAEHVRVRLDLEPGSLASPADELLEVADGHRRAALGHEEERRLTLGLPVQLAQRPQLAACQRVSRRRAMLCSG